MADFNPYAAPETDIVQRPRDDGDPAARLWRDGTLLVMDKTATLPEHCIVCNAPATGRPLRRRLSWHSGWWYLLALVNVLVYAIVAMIIQKKADIRVGLCDVHRFRRRMWMTIAWLLVLAAVLLPIILAVVANDDAAGLGCGLAIPIVLVAGLIGILGTRVVRATRIDETWAWLAGVSPDLLATLPEWSPGPPRA